MSDREQLSRFLDHGKFRRSNHADITLFEKAKGIEIRNCLWILFPFFVCPFFRDLIAADLFQLFVDLSEIVSWLFEDDSLAQFNCPTDWRRRYAGLFSFCIERKKLITFFFEHSRF